MTTDEENDVAPAYEEQQYGRLPSPGRPPPDARMLSPNSVQAIPKGFVTPQDVEQVAAVAALKIQVQIGVEEMRDQFEATLAGAMPANMPARVDATPEQYVGVPAAEAVAPRKTYLRHGQGYIKSGNRIVSVDYHDENAKFRDSAMPEGRWGSAAEARARALPTLKRQEVERNTRRQQEVQALQDEVRAKNAAFRDYVKKHYSDRPMSRPEQIDVEKEFDWVWDRRQADRKAAAADWARVHEEKPGLSQEDWRAEWAARKKIELDAEKSAWKDYVGTLPETKRTKHDWHSLYRRWYDKTWSQR